MNSMPSYKELLKINHALGEKIQELETKIQKMNYEIDEFLTASTMYRELYWELYFKDHK